MPPYVYRRSFRTFKWYLNNERARLLDARVAAIVERRLFDARVDAVVERRLLDARIADITVRTPQSGSFIRTALTVCAALIVAAVYTLLSIYALGVLLEIRSETGWSVRVALVL